MSRRLHYIDWLRVLAVLLLFPFHTLRVFNYGEPFYVKSVHLSVPVSYLLGFISMWHMQLLFALAGASTYFALQKRSTGQYVSERFSRLFVPFVAGIFIVMPPQTWYGARFNSGYTGSFIEYLTSGAFLVWNIRDGGDYYGGLGIGQLWFILFLFAISLIALPLFAWWRGERGSRAVARFSALLAKPGGWLLAAVLILLGEALPDLFGKALFYYLVFFVLGYAVMATEDFVTRAEQSRWIALVVGGVLCAAFVATGSVRDALPDPSWQRALFSLGGGLGTWLALIAAFGFGRRHLDRPSPALTYLAPASYPIYILHQTVIVVMAFYLVQLPVSGMVQWVVLLATSVLLTFAVYEGIRRIPKFRFLFGIRA